MAGAKLELFLINFVKDKMTLRVPTAKIVAVGMRKLAEPPVVKRALETLKGRPRIKRTLAAPRNTKQRSTPATSLRHFSRLRSAARALGERPPRSP